MGKPDDPLDGEVTISAKLEEKGITASAKSRLIAACDRLCGSAIDILGSRVERLSQKTRAETDAQVALIKTDGEAAVKRLEADATAGDRALRLYRGEASRKQANKDAIVIEAVHEMQTLPPPEKEEGAENYDQLSDDWMNVFSMHAENASSDRLRTLWARILAGEERWFGFSEQVPGLG